MTRFRNALLAGVFGLAALSPAVALAQPYTPPLVSSVGATDEFQDVVGGFPASTNYYATGPQLRGYILGQGGVRTAAPTLTTSTSICGGSTATVKGTDVSGQVAEGSTASTSCVITFAAAFVTAPECFVSINNVADTALKCATTTTTATITQTSASSNVLNYEILGLPGG